MLKIMLSALWRLGRNLEGVIGVREWPRELTGGIFLGRESRPKADIAIRV